MSALPEQYVKLAQRVGLEPTPDNMISVLEQIAALDDAAWGALGVDLQTYFNDVAEKLNGGQSPAAILGVVAESAKVDKPTQRRAAPAAPAAAESEGKAPPKAAPAKKPAVKAAKAALPSGTQRARELACLEPRLTVNQIMTRLGEEKVASIPSVSTVTTLLYEARAILAILHAHHRLVEGAPK